MGWILAEGDWIIWCGKQFNTKTLEIQRDFSKYAGHSAVFQSTSQSMTFGGANIGRKLRFSMKNSFPFYATYQYLDTKLNSIPTILALISNIFMLSAIRLACCERELPSKRANVPFLLGTYLLVSLSIH